MNDRVLEIMKNTNVTSIKDKENYTKLILYKKVDLKKFPNVKEVEFKFDPTIKHGMDFSHLEKIKFDSSIVGYQSLTLFHDYKYNSIQSCNIKSVEFGSNTNIISYKLFENSKNLEEIIFNVSNENIVCYNGNLNLENTNIQRIIIKHMGLEFPIELDYNPIGLGKNILFDKSSRTIKLEYFNKYITTKCTIQDGNISKDNILDYIDNKLINNNTLYVPDYVTGIKIYKNGVFETFDKLSLSLNILNGTSNIKNKDFKKMLNYNDIKSIELRSNNEMSLNKAKEISTEKYGKIKKMKISSGELKIDFENKTIIIDKSGNMKEMEIKVKCENNKIIEEQETKETTKPISSYEYEKLRLYTNFKEILQFFTNNDNKELKKSLDVVEKHLIKEIDKN